VTTGSGCRCSRLLVEAPYAADAAKMVSIGTRSLLCVCCDATFLPSRSSP
jgi:hypothetical protein